jgi:hypothetical protein
LFTYLTKTFQKNDLSLTQDVAMEVAGATAQAGCTDLLQRMFLCPKVFPIDATSKDQQGNTLLHYAAAGGNSDSKGTIDLLLGRLDASEMTRSAYVNQPNIQGQTALHAAVAHMLFKNVSYLLGLHARADIPDKDGKTPLMLAEELKNEHEATQYSDILLAIVRKLRSATP